jgi:hypothetical protein
MKMLLLGLALAALPASGESPANSGAAITLYSDFQQPPPPAVLDAMEDEIHAIMAPLGLRFEWRLLNAPRGGEAIAELAVITFRGRCDVEGLVPVTLHPGALGWTHVSDGVILPFSDVDCDGIRGFLQAALIRMKSEDRDEAYGRAIGRVLAHELYHIFADTQKHGTSGVAKAVYTVRELLSHVFTFEGRASNAIRSGKGKAVMQAAAVRP